MPKHEGCCKKMICGKKITSDGLVIKKPGTYLLKEDIDFSPLFPKTSAITIDSDNVVLNLCSHVLKQTNTMRQTVGIKVKTGHNNIKIINGTVTNFSMKGIQFEGNTDAIILGEEGTYLNVLECGKGSKFSYFDNISEEKILQNGIQLGLSFKDQENGFGKYLGPVSNIQMTNVLCEKNSPCGLHLGDIINLVAKNSSFSKNEGFRFVSPNDNFKTISSSGMEYNPVQKNDSFGALEFISCNFNSQIIKKLNLEVDEDTQSITHAVNIDPVFFSDIPIPDNAMTTKTFTFEKCNFNDNVNESDIEISRCYILTGPEAGLTVNLSNCSFKRNKSGFNVIVVSIAGGIVENCIFSENISRGIACLGVSQTSTIRNNILEENKAEGGSSIDVYTGPSTKIERPKKVITIEGNIIKNKNFDGIILTTRGIPSTDLSLIVIKNNTIIQSKIGIYYPFPSVDDIVCNNIIDSCDQGIVLFSRNSENFSKCITVQGNKIYNATSVGIIDNVEKSSNLVIQNQVWNSNSGIEVNYPSGPAPTKTGSLATGIPIDVGLLDNVVITKM